MNKLFIAALLCIGFFISSCTREYICQCSLTYDGVQPGLPDSAIHEFKIKDVKDEAIKKCETNSNSSSLNGVTTTEKCRLF